MPRAPKATVEDGSDAVARHARKLARIAADLMARKSGRPVSRRKRAVSHLVPRRDDPRRHADRIDVRDLDEILAIDPEARTCIAEPGVTFEALVRATLEHGLVPIVVPELATITIGGAVAGCSLESMSWRHGGFHDACLEYELVTGRGDVLRCTPDDPDERLRLVFQMMHGSFGTQGILTRLKFRLVPARDHVHVVYETHTSLAAYLAAIDRHAAAADMDFMDGIIHTPTRLVLALGRFVDEAPYTHRYDWTRVYWKSTARRHEDYLRTPDYFFRYDHGVTNVHPKSAIGRLLLGKFVHSAQVLRLAQRLPWLLPKGEPDVTVDVFVPRSRVADFMAWYEDDVGFFPLWCVPYRRVRDYEWIADGYFAGLDDELFIDLAIYGMKQPPGRDIYRELEDALLRVRGIKTLISHNRYDEDTFWTIFNRRNHEAAKAITDPDGIFGDLYDKTVRSSGAGGDSSSATGGSSP